MCRKIKSFDLSAHLQHADQREQTPRRIVVNIGLAGKSCPVSAPSLCKTRRA